jgi:hypothetical protein
MYSSTPLLLRFVTVAFSRWGRVFSYCNRLWIRLNEVAGTVSFDTVLRGTPAIQTTLRRIVARCVWIPPDPVPGKSHGEQGPLQRLHNRMNKEFSLSRLGGFA